MAITHLGIGGPARAYLGFSPKSSFVITPAADFSFLMEMELDGFMNGWTPNRDVLLRIPLTGDRGLPDSTPRALVAKTGMMWFALDNSEQNSAKTIRYYTPGDPNCRPGFKKGIGVRFSFVINGEQIPQFTGRLEDIQQTPGVFGSRTTYCQVVDFMNETTKKRLSTLTLQRNISEVDAFQTVIGTIPLQPRAIEVGTSVDTLEYAFDTIQDERTTPMNEIQRLNQGTLARVYVKANGTLTYEPRSVRALNIENTIIDLGPSDFEGEGTPEVDDNRATVVNRVTIQLHPRTPSEEPDRVLYESTSPFVIPPLIDISIRGYYSQDTLRAKRAGGLDMLPAEPNTDYVFNTAADGSGEDLTSLVTVDTIYTANSVIFTINSPVPAWATKFQSRGTQIIDNANMSVFAEDQQSIADNGEVAFSLDMPYVSDPTFGSEVAQYILYLAQANQKRVKSVKMELTRLSADRANLIARREISDRFSVSEPMNAIESGAFFINAISFERDTNGRYWVSWLPTIADSTQYWFLEIPGFSELDFTTRLGFGLIIGHTDIDHDDFHTDDIHLDLAHGDTHGDDAHGDAAHVDSAHTDVAHGDVAHGDNAHTDSHSDFAHGDTTHDDSHGDVAHSDNHGDTAHVDTAHGDIAFQGYTDTHNDVHGDTHEDDHFDHDDVPFAHEDDHIDVHDDSHNDSHIDDGGHPHVDSPHFDGAHTDSHADGAHSDGHVDIAHADNGHGDSHNDIAHGDVLHTDSHADSGHSDAAHSDEAHSDNHVDTPHDDAAHGDSHGDMAHGDHN